MSGLILTEEELKEIESTYGRFNPTILRLIAAQRILLSANAELSFYKNKYHEALNSIVNGQWTSYLDDDKLRVWQTDRIDPKKIALEALEDAK